MIFGGKGGINLDKNFCIIDRFEGDKEKWAVIEYKGLIFNVPRNLLPEGAGEGDVLEFNIRVNKKETENRREQIDGLVEDLFK